MITNRSLALILYQINKINQKFGKGSIIGIDGYNMVYYRQTGNKEYPTIIDHPFKYDSLTQTLKVMGHKRKINLNMLP